MAPMDMATACQQAAGEPASALGRRAAPPRRAHNPSGAVVPSTGIGRLARLGAVDQVPETAQPVWPRSREPLQRGQDVSLVQVRLLDDLGD